MALDDRVWKLGIEKKLWLPNQKILVACSGGVDSMSLLDIFRQWRDRGRIELAAVHCNHGLRGAESDRDALEVEEWCSKNNIPCFVRNLDVRESLARQKGNLEERARDLRYEALEQVRMQISADWIALGHHGGDQAETVLLHLFRGSGVFRGMREHQRKCIRPLLEVPKQEIISYAREKGLPYWEDYTNEEVDFRRNWIRQELLPLLAEKIQPNLEEVLGRWATIQWAEEDFWQNRSEAWIKEHVKEREGKWQFSVAAFDLLSLAEKRQILHRISTIFSDEDRGIAFKHVESLLRLIENKIGNSQVDLFDFWIGRIEKGQLIFQKKR